MWGRSGISNGGISRSSSGRKKSARFDDKSSSSGLEAAAGKLFDKYKDEEDPRYISMEGISQLCDDIGIDPMEDIRVLVLMWKLGANEKPGHISNEEWVKGCVDLDIDSVQKIKAMLPGLDPGFLEREDFKEFYKFTFQFNREGTHRTLDKGLVIALLQLVLKDRVDHERLSTWNEFLEQTTGESYSRITLDQWSSFLEFCYEVNDLEKDFDEENSAWPVLIDEYVEYMAHRTN